MQPHNRYQARRSDEQEYKEICVQYADHQVASMVFGAGAVFAQGYPTKPIKMIVPYPAGGQTDVLARMTAQKLSDELGKPVVVENRPGASGMLGSRRCRLRPPTVTRCSSAGAELFVSAI